MTDLAKRDPIDPENTLPTFNRILVRILFDEEALKDFDEVDGVATLRKSNLFLPRSVVEAKQEELAMKRAYHVRAELVKAGPFAYQGIGYPEHLIPKPGDNVYINNNPGMEFTDTTGNIYRICNEKDVIAILKDNPDGRNTTGDNPGPADGNDTASGSDTTGGTADA